MQVHITGGYFISDCTFLFAFGSNYIFAVEDKEKVPSERVNQFLIHHVICLVAFSFALKAKTPFLAGSGQPVPNLTP